MTNNQTVEKRIRLRPVFFVEAIIVLAFFGLAIWSMRGKADQTETTGNPSQLVARADSDFDAHDLSQALLTYWQAVRSIQSKSDPKLNGLMLHAHVRISDIYFQSGWIEDAFQHLQKAVDINPDHIAIYLLQGKLFRDQGARVEAVRAFLKVLEQDAHHPEAHYQSGILYQGSNQFDLAVDHYQQAIAGDLELKSGPSSPTAFGLLARLQLARAYHRRSQKLQFSDQELTDEQIEDLNRMADSAIQFLEEAVSLDPDFAEAKQELIDRLYGQASSLERSQGNIRLYDQALQVYQRITELDPDEVDAWLSIGQIHRSFLDDPTSALEAFRVAYQLDPRTDTLAEIRTLEEELGLNSESSESQDEN